MRMEDDEDNRRVKMKIKMMTGRRVNFIQKYLKGIVVRYNRDDKTDNT